MTTYRLDTINFKDGEFRVKVIPNAEPLEFVVSGKGAEQFFNALKANDYKTDKLCISTCLKSNGNNADKICINVPCASGCETEPGKWIECEFKSEPEQDKQEPSIVRRIQMGEYNGKPLYWIYLGHYDDETDLFLSEDIICKRRFDAKSNDWFNSELAEWLSCEFSKEAFLPSEYRQLVPLPCIDKGSCGFKLFLLSEDEYEMYRSEIPDANCWWWLRTRRDNTCYVAFVYSDASVSINGVLVNNNGFGVRPALRLRRS
jgi:hypothetical protein